MTKTFVESYFDEVVYIADTIDTGKIDELVNQIKHLNGRIFVLGIGGSAGNASHMVNDLRKLCNIEAYAPTDNVSEFSARTNDDGFDTVFIEYLKTSNLSDQDAIFILSVGGGNKYKDVSVNLIKAVDYANKVQAKVLGIVGREDGYTAMHGDTVLVVPAPYPERLTPHSEAFQSVVWHCIISHPDLAVNKTTW